MADPAASRPTVSFDDMPANWLTNPDGLAVATAAVAIFLAFFASVVVSLRAYARRAIGAFGIDDGLMVIAVNLFNANSILCVLDCFAGLGSRDEKVLANPWNGPAATMYLVLWRVSMSQWAKTQITYAWSLPFIKCSICFSLFRITQERRHTIPLICIMVLATFSAILGFIAVIITCQPIAKNWDPVLQNDPDYGACMDYSIIQNISYFISASSIVTDWACAILPCFIVWNLNMKRKLKFSVAGILALGAFASLSTIIRLPYLGAYTAPVDHYYKVANIIIWSEIECGVGIIAGSLPSLRGFIKSIIDRSTNRGSSYNNQHSPDDDENSNSHHFVTIGGTGGDRATAAAASNIKLGSLGCTAKNSTTCEAMPTGTHARSGSKPSTAGRDDAWAELDSEDSESQKRMITRTHGYSVRVEHTHEEGPVYAM
ncbi:uncharacterized protein PG986_012960 [Apiospora aurea]|uniref:Rhodopsin domain-containing protein n=1 Tax=Apiospora aurea TaxID=335848 RepID=A0ABR1Q1H0_9PEZI